MSLIGPKRTRKGRPSMSAFEGKADIALTRRECRTTPSLHCYIVQSSGVRVRLRRGRMAANVKFAVLVLYRFETVRMGPELKSVKTRSNETGVIEQRDHHWGRSLRTNACHRTWQARYRRRRVGRKNLAAALSRCQCHAGAHYGALPPPRLCRQSTGAGFAVRLPY